MQEPFPVIIFPLRIITIPSLIGPVQIAFIGFMSAMFGIVCMPCKFGGFRRNGKNGLVSVNQ